MILARQYARQIMGALLGAAIVHDHRRDHLEPHGGEVGRPGPRALGGEDIAFDLAPAGAAELGGPVGRRPAARVQYALPRQRHFGIDEDAGRARRSEEHTSELQSLMRISYAVFCLKKKKTHNKSKEKRTKDSEEKENNIKRQI